MDVGVAVLTRLFPVYARAFFCFGELATPAIDQVACEGEEMLMVGSNEEKN